MSDVQTIGTTKPVLDDTDTWRTTLAPEQPAASWGVCRWWSVDGCHGYRGDGTQACQDCGHGFGAHF